MRHRRLTAALAVLAAAATAGAVLTHAPDPAAASVGSDRFYAGEPYDGDFADPSVLRVGDRYYAYATNTDGNHLPTMTSTDLATWTPREPLPDYWRYRSWAGYNDAMPTVPDWLATNPVHTEEGTQQRPEIWAPNVTEVRGRYVAAYSGAVTFSPRRNCIGLAVSSSPQGKFTSIDPADGTRPFECSTRDAGGSIDPQVFVDPNNQRVYLLWKDEGKKRSHPTRIWIRRMNKYGTAFKAGSRKRMILQTEKAWEGNVIENPNMIRHDGRLYLFYSANTWFTDDYATGYAICDRPTRGCVRARRTPLLATGGTVAGPGGASAFVDTGGRLRLGYAAWDAGRVGYPSDSSCRETPAGCNQRRLHIARLKVKASGRLRVVDRG